MISRTANNKRASGYVSSTLRKTRITISSSPRCVLPAIMTGLIPSTRNSCRICCFSASVTSTYVSSYLVFPVIVTLSGKAPIEIICSASIADCMQKALICKSILDVNRLISEYLFIERSLILPFIIMTGIFLCHANRKKLGHSSVSIRIIALGFTISTILSVIIGKSKGKKICPSASGIIF